MFISHIFYKHLFFLLLISTSLKAQWTCVLEKENISVYQKPNEGELYYYMATTIIDVSIDSLYSFFLDFENYPNWVNYCNKIEVIDFEENLFYVYYSFFDMPWPARNRDAITKLTIRKDSNSIIVNSVPSKIEYNQKNNTVRVNQFEEKYELTSITKCKTKLIIQGGYNPGGFVPEWLIYKMLKYGPYDILAKIRAITEK